MNSERLHAIARELQADFNQIELASYMANLANYIGQLSQNPGDANASQQVASTRQLLEERLTNSRTNDFSDLWRLALEELGIWECTGDRLRDHIEEIFRRNEITPNTAATEINDTNTRVQTIITSIENLNSALDAIGIGSEELAPGEFEVGFLIPREAVDNEIEQLGEEFEKLDQILGPFQELTLGNRPDLKVRSIGSSEFQVIVMVAPTVALTISKVIESLLSSYEKIKNIRAKTSSLEEEDDVPAEIMDGLRTHANERMEIDINALTEQLLTHATAEMPPGRAHELRIDVKRSLVRLANRIDEGYSIEVRAFSPPEEAEGEESPDGGDDGAANAAREIEERQPRMRRMNLTGKPILELPEGDDEPEDEAAA